MHTAYRRHSNECSLGMGERKCKCPIWVNGRVRGKLVRKALKTRNWEEGQRWLRDWEMEGTPLSSVSVVEACDRFMEYQTSRNLRAASLAKYALLTKELKQELRGSIGGVSRNDLETYRHRGNFARNPGHTK